MKNTYIIYRIHVIQINEMAWSLRVRKYTQMNKKESRLKKKKRKKSKVSRAYEIDWENFQNFPRQ